VGWWLGLVVFTPATILAPPVVHLGYGNARSSVESFILNLMMSSTGFVLSIFACSEYSGADMSGGTRGSACGWGQVAILGGFQVLTAAIDVGFLAEREVPVDERSARPVLVPALSRSADGDVVVGAAGAF
jgi:hypothetical protein